MHIIGDCFSDFFREKQSAVTVGNFDGQHIGHRLLFDSAVNCARENSLFSVVFSFRPHPVLTFGDRPDFRLITSYDERSDYINRIGPDFFIEYPFTLRYAQTEPKDFLEFIFKELNCKTMFIGEGYRFGKGRSGDIADFQSFFDSRGVELVRVPHVMRFGEKVSSTTVRELILAGDFEKAKSLTGRDFYVTSSRENTADLGSGKFALSIPPEKILPRAGSYGVTFGDENFFGVLHIPQFGSEKFALLECGEFHIPEGTKKIELKLKSIDGTANYYRGN